MSTETERVIDMLEERGIPYTISGELGIMDLTDDTKDYFNAMFAADRRANENPVDFSLPSSECYRQ
jgi:hypothetical protein|tara:strand:+ start:9776 stop:9973 length:198 start_codon:yes stop_codon:yes gene_type:complete